MIIAILVGLAMLNALALAWMAWSARRADLQARREGKKGGPEESAPEEEKDGESH